MRIKKWVHLAAVAAFLIPSLTFAQQVIQVVNPLGSTTSLCGLIKNFLNVVLAVGIPTAVLFVAYAGFLFVLALGNPEKLAKAKRNAVYVAIGMGIFFGAWVILQIFVTTINSIAQGGGINFSVTSCQ